MELFKDFLPETRRDFDKLHKAMYIALSDVQRRLNVGEWRTGPEAQYLQDLERAQSITQTGTRTRAPSYSVPPAGDDTEGRLRAVQLRLEEELENQTIDDTPMASRRPSFDAHTTSATTRPATTLAPTPAPEQTSSSPHSEKENPSEEKGDSILPLSVPASQDNSPCTIALRKRWDLFRTSQFERLGDVMASGALHGGIDELFVEEPQPSMSRTWGPDPVRGDIHNGDHKDHKEHATSATYEMLEGLRNRARARGDESPITAIPKERRGSSASQGHASLNEEDTLDAHHSLTRVYSFLFAMNGLVDAIISLHHFTERGIQDGKKAPKPRKKRLHVHISESMRLGRIRRKAEAAEIIMSRQGADDGKEEPMTMREALSTLEGKPYVPVHRSIWQRLGALEMALRSTNSICAFKSARESGSATPCLLTADVLSCLRRDDRRCLVLGVDDESLGNILRAQLWSADHRRRALADPRADRAHLHSANLGTRCARSLS